MDDGIDAYRVLQVDPAAEPGVVHAAYRALARIYHPDGASPDAARMAAINRAWSLIGMAEARQRYDAHRRLRATGPGFVNGHGMWRASASSSPSSASSASAASSASSAPDAPPMPRPRYDAWAQSHAAAAPARSDSGTRTGGPAGATTARMTAGETVLDFGRYAGWRLLDILRHDADYLRWLCRQSAGVRYREQILRLLPNEPDLDRRSKSVA